MIEALAVCDPIYAATISRIPIPAQAIALQWDERSEPLWLDAHVGEYVRLAEQAVDESHRHVSPPHIGENSRLAYLFALSALLFRASSILRIVGLRIAAFGMGARLAVEALEER
jgi:hypothetical protein